MTKPSDSIRAHDASGKFRKQYMDAVRVESEVEKPGQLLRQTCLVDFIAHRYESVAELIDAQLPYVTAMIRSADWHLWRDDDYELIEHWVRRPMMIGE